MNNIEKYIKENYKNIDMSILLDLFFQEEYFYTLTYSQPIPLNSKYLTLEVKEQLMGLIFTSERELEEYIKSEPLVKDWIKKKYKTEEFENYFKDINENINGILINYPNYWVTLYLK